jgi:hypothetical protein
MTITNGYATLAEVKAYINTSSTNAGDDAVIEDMVEMASRLIDKETGRTFYARTETHYFDYTSSRSLYMDDDLLTVTTLTNGNGAEIPDTEYNIFPLNKSPKSEIRIKQSSTYYWDTDGYSNTEGVISVAGTWGYSATAPDNIKHACISIVISAYHRRYGEGVEGVATITAAGVVITPRDIPADAWAIIRSYRKRL